MKMGSWFLGLRLVYPQIREAVARLEQAPMQAAEELLGLWRD